MTARLLGDIVPQAQRGIRSVIYDVFEKVTLDVLLKDVLGEMLDAHVAKVFYTLSLGRRQKGVQEGAFLGLICEDYCSICEK